MFSWKQFYKIKANGNKTIDEQQNSSEPSALDRTFIKLKLFKEQHQQVIFRTKIFFLNAIVVGFWAWATYHFIESSTYRFLMLKYKKKNVQQNRSMASGHMKLTKWFSFSLERQYDASTNWNETDVVCGVQYCGIQWCDGYGMLNILLAFMYVGLFYYQIKRFYGNQIGRTLLPIRNRIYILLSLR